MRWRRWLWAVPSPCCLLQVKWYDDNTQVASHSIILNSKRKGKNKPKKDKKTARKKVDISVRNIVTCIARIPEYKMPLTLESHTHAVKFRCWYYVRCVSVWGFLVERAFVAITVHRYYFIEFLFYKQYKAILY